MLLLYSIAAGLLLGRLAGGRLDGLATVRFRLMPLALGGLIKGRQVSRFIFYAADYPVMDQLIAFLTHNCCQGETCLPATASTCAPAKPKAKAKLSAPHTTKASL